MKSTITHWLLPLVLILLAAKEGHAFVHTSVPNGYFIERLDSALVNSGTYEQQLRVTIDSLKTLINETADSAARLPLILECAREWQKMSTDSTIALTNDGIRLASETGNKDYEQLLTCERSKALFYGGQIDEAMRDLRNIYGSAKKKSVINACDRVAVTINLTHGLFNFGHQSEIDYKERARYHVGKLMSRLTPSDSILTTYYQGYIHFIDGNVPATLDCFSKVIDNTAEDDKMNAVAHTIMGNLLIEEEDYECAVTHLAIAARFNVMRADRQMLPMLKLVEALYELNNYVQASKYISHSLHSAVDGGMRYNLMRYNNVMLDINEAVEKDRHRRSMMLVGLLATLLLLLAILAYQTYQKRLEVERLRIAEGRLARANKAKDTYITEFMNLCSSYIESLDAYNSMSIRKIAAGQTEQLLEFMRSGKIIDQQRDKFFDVFDQAFHKLFPDYVDQVNSLLQPTRRITVNSPGDLTTELRVLALARLGIDDAQAIARFLGVTPNTIYTYRNKLRNRAIDRETFDEAAKQITPE